MTLRLFVYGTLCPGHTAWSVLEPWVVGTPSPDAVKGCLYDTRRGYPAATFSAEQPGFTQESGGGSLVHGTVVEIDPEQSAAALAALDDYEGHEYARVWVRTEAGVEATAYAWTAPLTGCRALAGGRWID